MHACNALSRIKIACIEMGVVVTLQLACTAGAMDDWMHAPSTARAGLDRAGLRHP